MKKFLSLLSGISIVATSSTSVVSCFNDPININEYIKITDLGILYYPKGIKKENSLPSEYELWSKIIELNPTLERQFLGLKNVKITNITFSSAQVEGIGSLPYIFRECFGKLIINFKNEEKENMLLSDVIKERNFFSFPNVKIKLNDSDNPIDYKHFTTEYLNKFYPKIKDAYFLKDITPIAIKNLINTNEYLLPIDNLPLTEEYIWNSIKENNKFINENNEIIELTKNDLGIHVIFNPLNIKEIDVDILGKGPKFDGGKHLYFKKEINSENLIKNILPNKDNLNKKWWRQDRYYEMSKNPESNIEINEEVIIIKVKMEPIF